MPYLKKVEFLILVGNHIRNTRIKKNLTQKDVAIKAGIAVSQVGRMERGKLNSSVSTLFAISHAMEIELKDLFQLEKIKR